MGLPGLNILDMGAILAAEDWNFGVDRPFVLQKKLEGKTLMKKMVCFMLAMLLCLSSGMALAEKSAEETAAVKQDVMEGLWLNLGSVGDYAQENFGHEQLIEFLDGKIYFFDNGRQSQEPIFYRADDTCFWISDDESEEKAINYEMFGNCMVLYEDENRDEYSEIWQRVSNPVSMVNKKTERQDLAKARLLEGCWGPVDNEDGQCYLFADGRLSIFYAQDTQKMDMGPYTINGRYIDVLEQQDGAIRYEWLNRGDLLMLYTRKGKVLLHRVNEAELRDNDPILAGRWGIDSTSLAECTLQELIFAEKHVAVIAEQEANITGYVGRDGELVFDSILMRNEEGLIVPLTFNYTVIDDTLIMINDREAYFMRRK